MFNLAFKPDLVYGIDGAPAYIEGDLQLKWDNHIVYSWRANSGGHGAGPLPHNTYVVSKVDILPDTDRWNSFRKDWKPWWAAIKAKFKIDRTALGIHPDGGVKGSLGCLVLMLEDQLFYETLEETLEGQPEILLTVY